MIERCLWSLGLAVVFTSTAAAAPTTVPYVGFLTYEAAVVLALRAEGSEIG